MKATEQYFHVVLCSMLYKVVLTFKSGSNPNVLQFKFKKNEPYFRYKIVSKLTVSKWKCGVGQIQMTAIQLYFKVVFLIVRFFQVIFFKNKSVSIGLRVKPLISSGDLILISYHFVVEMLGRAIGRLKLLIMYGSIVVSVEMKTS